MTPPYSARILTLLVLMITSIGGCLMSPMSVPITYQPESNVMPVPGASSVHVHVVGEDQRANTANVGQYDQQSVVTSNNVADTARDAVQSELQARGFVIDKRPASTEVRVQVVSLSGHFFSSLFYSSYTAELIMQVEVVRPGQVIAYSQSFDATDTTHPAVFGSVSKDFGDALGGALKQGVEKLFDDPAFMNALLAKPSQPSMSPPIQGK
jgi:uncharacterized lipoprotein YajG